MANISRIDWCRKHQDTDVPCPHELQIGYQTVQYLDRWLRHGADTAKLPVVATCVSIIQKVGI